MNRCRIFSFLTLVLSLVIVEGIPIHPVTSVITSTADVPETTRSSTVDTVISEGTESGTVTALTTDNPLDDDGMATASKNQGNVKTSTSYFNSPDTIATIKLSVTPVGDVERTTVTTPVLNVMPDSGSTINQTDLPDGIIGIVSDMPNVADYTEHKTKSVAPDLLISLTKITSSLDDQTESSHVTDSPDSSFYMLNTSVSKENKTVLLSSTQDFSAEELNINGSMKELPESTHATDVPGLHTDMLKITKSGVNQAKLESAEQYLSKNVMDISGFTQDQTGSSNTSHTPDGRINMLNITDSQENDNISASSTPDFSNYVVNITESLKNQGGSSHELDVMNVYNNFSNKTDSIQIIDQLVSTERNESAIQLNTSGSLQNQTESPNANSEHDLQTGLTNVNYTLENKNENVMLDEAVTTELIWNTTRSMENQPETSHVSDTQDLRSYMFNTTESTVNQSTIALTAPDLSDNWINLTRARRNQNESLNLSDKDLNINSLSETIFTENQTMPVLTEQKLSATEPNMLGSKDNQIEKVMLDEDVAAEFISWNTTRSMENQSGTSHVSGTQDLRSYMFNTTESTVNQSTIALTAPDLSDNRMNLTGPRRIHNESLIFSDKDLNINSLSETIFTENQTMPGSTEQKLNATEPNMLGSIDNQTEPLYVTSAADLTVDILNVTDHQEKQAKLVLTEQDVRTSELDVTRSLTYQTQPPHYPRAPNSETISGTTIHSTEHNNDQVVLEEIDVSEFILWNNTDLMEKQSDLANDIFHDILVLGPWDATDPMEQETKTTVSDGAESQNDATSDGLSNVLEISVLDIMKKPENGSDETDYVISDVLEIDLLHISEMIENQTGEKKSENKFEAVNATLRNTTYNTENITGTISLTSNVTKRKIIDTTDSMVLQTDKILPDTVTTRNKSENETDLTAINLESSGCQSCSSIILFVLSITSCFMSL